jgi:hypothetical protein
MLLTTTVVTNPITKLDDSEFPNGESSDYSIC